ncbi:MAG: hypothetical protein GY807_00995 [Gammaproteobacteria bacterium]|nr:hypothetical protein [Gammaproteobacteria bacterium]
MGRAGISKKQVFEAAGALTDEGVSATVQAVRQRIGSGSFSTISAHLADWKAEHAGQVPANIPDMPEKVTLAFAQVWAVAGSVRDTCNLLSLRKSRQELCGNLNRHRSQRLGYVLIQNIPSKSENMPTHVRT